MKRKRKGGAKCEEPNKRQRVNNEGFAKPTWPLLQQYYPGVLTLRSYLLSALERGSKKRRRRLCNYGNDEGDDAALVHLLDTTIIGTFNNVETNDFEAIEKDLTVFTQQLSILTSTISLTQGALKQSEIVDFAVWRLFRKHPGVYRPPHLLAYGFQRWASGADYNDELAAVPGVPGIVSNGRHANIDCLKRSPWNGLPSLLGKGAERILSDLLVHCGIFQPVENSNNLKQLSGVPLSDLKVTSNPTTVKSVNTTNGHVSNERKTCEVRGLNKIRFVRHRILYAKPTLSSKGEVHFHLGHAHVLNRYRNVSNSDETIHVMRYVFPWQFGHHNAFTSDTNPKDTAQPFKDYTIREKEIAQAKLRWRRRRGACADSESPPNQAPLPRRIRGEAMLLVSRLRKRHARCSYHALLDHYCPRPRLVSSDGSMERASSLAQVSAFCRAVVGRVFPDYFWGTVRTREHNKKLILSHVDTFIRLRRYETMSLHDVLQKIRVSEIEWLAPANRQGAKLSQSDFAKRKELLAELVYYLFDSFVIPLVRGHFYVTESGAQRNQLFYFRHDEWKEMCEPALSALKQTMLEPCDKASVRKALSRRALGVSRIRLVPKDHGMRPIINLRRRVQRLQHGQVILGRSINSIMTPAFSALNYEKSAHPERLASALFCVDDIYPRLQAFRQSLEEKGLAGQPLFFAKVDVRACFDTIPQKRLMELAKRILAADQYHIMKYSRARLIGAGARGRKGVSIFGAKPSWRFLTKATATGHDFDFDAEVQADTADGRSRTIYVDGGLQKCERRRAIIDLLQEHIGGNLIQLGNRTYRQKEGIPQGSVVSSLLCSYFYAELEREALSFVHEGPALLLRLIDDFLVISTQREVAERFLRVMHAGVPAFGVAVKPDKSRANFDVRVADGTSIPRLPAATAFPYCGAAIDTVTLDLGRDRERRRRANLAAAVTVEASALPGRTFYRKILTALKLQMHPMLLSTRYNTPATVLENLQLCFTEVASKCYFYLCKLPKGKQPEGKLVIRTVAAVIQLACVLMQRRKRHRRDLLPYECSIPPGQTRWIACTAFREVFARRQTKHRELVAWLEGELRRLALWGRRQEQQQHSQTA